MGKKSVENLREASPRIGSQPATQMGITPTPPPERRDLPGRPLPIQEPSGDRLLFVNSGRGYVR